MIIGSGLIANSFENIKFKENITLFASGVSNSLCSDLNEFNREIQLLLDVKKLSKNNTLIYFSSCAVSLEETEYYVHKRNMESIIKDNFDNYIIFRLPQIIGKSNNNKTLLNFLIHSVNNKLFFKVQRNATRYFIDINDLVKIVQIIVDRKLYYNNTYNIVIPIKYTISEIVQSVETILQKKAIYDIIDGGTDYSIETNFITAILKENDITYDKNYLENCLSNLLA
jgi:UDP-2-acetamido-2,6-beta-L-arabino-hexul-4-ose reductase